VIEKTIFRSSCNWLLGDHLGSTSMVTDASGGMVSEVRYSAFGETRYQNGTLTTDYLYTGQREEAEIGLYYYVARWYDPAIGRFVQADSVVPDPGSALGFDRYAYVNNNPLKYVDPSGHWEEESKKQYCTGDGSFCLESGESIWGSFGVSLTSESGASWDNKESVQGALLKALIRVGFAFRNFFDNQGTIQEAFQRIFSPLKFQMCFGGVCEQYNQELGKYERNVSSGMITQSQYKIDISGFLGKKLGLSLENNFIHELGHVFNILTNRTTQGNMNAWNIANPDYHRTTTTENFGFASAGFPWQQATTNLGSGSEDFADSFLGWTSNMWEDSSAGRERAYFMKENMPLWVKMIP